MVTLLQGFVPMAIIKLDSMFAWTLSFVLVSGGFFVFYNYLVVPQKSGRSEEYLEYKKAQSKTGPTGHNLLIMLESRLDNTVFRLGLAPTRRAARQLVSHKHFLVNNRCVNIPSFQLKPDDIINVRDKSKKMDLFQDSLRKVQGDNPMPWLEIDKAQLKGKFISIPDREEITEPLNEQLIVELYSK